MVSKVLIKKMTNFDNDLTNLPKVIKFCATKSSFLQQLTKAFENKTSKLCKVSKEQHEKQCYHNILQKG